MVLPSFDLPSGAVLGEDEGSRLCNPTLFIGGEAVRLVCFLKNTGIVNLALFFAGT